MGQSYDKNKQTNSCKKRSDLWLLGVEEKGLDEGSQKVQTKKKKKKKGTNFQL